MIISIIGNIDKRAVAYPLMRALAIQGKTAVITDDSSFNRLYLEDSNKGQISNVDILITNEINKDNDKELDNKSEEIVNKLFISKYFVHPNSDKTVIVRGVDRSMSVLKDIDEDDDIEDDENDTSIEDDVQKVFEIIVSTEQPQDKIKGLQLLSGDDLKYLWDTEEHKELIKVSKNLIKIVSPIVESMLGISKNEATKLINRDLVTVGK